MNDFGATVGAGLLLAFFVLLAFAVAPHAAIFAGRFARTHRVAGAAHTVLLLAALALSSPLLDTLLGLLGVLLAMSAARAFGRRRTVPPAQAARGSGTLLREHVVTRAEMLEHAWYQALMAAQALYLHTLAILSAPHWRLLAALAVTVPWLTRAWVPKHSFRTNYEGKETTFVNILYRIKKWQYVFYKHCLLHGLNASVALEERSMLLAEPSFRVLWVALNASYTMEFFLQTLVHAKRMEHRTMLLLNALLMAAASIAALNVLYLHVSPVLAFVSFALNMAAPGHDFLAMWVILGVGECIKTI